MADGAGGERDATAVARAVVRRLVASGVRELVLAPGSRNAPLAFAAWDADRAGLLRLHTRIDERTAGFLALGLTRSGSRAAVVVTSGTAVANLHPAVMEAAHAGLPLVAVTADRPASLRGTGASQTTDQVRVFGASARFADVASLADVEALDLGPGAVRGEPVAPLQVNVQLVPPLVPAGAAADEPWWEGVESPERAASTTWDRVEGAHTLPRGPRTVVVAGDDAGPPARTLAEAAGWPLLAEPTAGCRTGEHALRCYRLLLDGPLGQAVERVVVAGHPTLSRPVTRLLERADVEVVALPARGRWARRPFAVDAEHPALVVEGGPSEAETTWCEAWWAADRELSRRVDALIASRSGSGEGTSPLAVAEAVHRTLPPHGLLVVGASNPVRDLDLVARPHPVGTHRKVVANRGLAGIDGTLSTAIGAALGRPRSSRAVALVGDVTFLHDAGALVLGPDEPRPDLTVVVVNDDGGSIFASLEQGAPEHADRFERLFGTPHGVDLASLCAATRTPHWRVDSVAELEHALASPAGGIEVVEVRVRRDDRREVDAALRGLAADLG